MKPVGTIGTAALVLLLGTTAPVWAQDGKQNEEQAKADKQDKGKGNAKAGKQQDQGQKAAPQAKQQQDAQQQDRNQKQQQAHQDQGGRQQQEQQQQHAAQQQANQQQQQRAAQQQANQQQQQRAAQQQANQQQQQHAAQQQANEQQQQHAAQQQANQQRLANQQQQVEEQQQANRQRQAQHQQQLRLPQERQRQLIDEQQRRVVEYRQQLDQQQLHAEEYAARLRQQKRMANYRFQQDYLARMGQQQLALQRSYDYNNDPYFYTASSYRYSRGGSYYETNEYGADMLRRAINNGYAEGYRAGQADRQDRWASDYQNSYAYQDANYGYNGYYVNQADYNYYFREGFNRGYQDGYDSRTQFGQYSNGSPSILGAVLSQILNLQSIRY